MDIKKKMKKKWLVFESFMAFTASYTVSESVFC